MIGVFKLTAFGGEATPAFVGGPVASFVLVILGAAFVSSGEARLCCFGIAFCELCLSGFEIELGTLELAPSFVLSALFEEPAPLSREDVEYFEELFCEAKMLCTLFR